MEYTEPQFYRLMQYAGAAGGDVVDLVSGSPDWGPPDALREALREYADLPVDAFQYPPSPGLRELREEIAARRGVDVEQVVVTNGTGEANYLAMARALTRDAGTDVLLSDPVYPYYPGKAELLGGEPRLVPAARDGTPDVEAFRAAASDETALIVLTTPNNPTGAVYDRETVAEIVSIAEANDALVAVDEVYDHFDLTGEFESALTIDSPNRIVTSGFSKSLAVTGLRVGYGVFPHQHVEAAKTRHMLVNVTGPRPSQYAVVHALRETPPEYYADARSLLADRFETFTTALDAIDAEYVRPEGGFYVFTRFDKFPGSMANAKRLIDEGGVAGMPGETFGEARADWFRFALLSDRVPEAADRLRRFFG